MTEAPGGDGLARALALCALGYSATARERLLPLLHEEMERARSEVMATVRALYERGDIATYFGSIRRGDESDSEMDDEEEEEYDEQEQESGESVQEATRDGSGSRHLVMLLAAAAAALLVVALLSLFGNDTSARKATSDSVTKRGAAGGDVSWLRGRSRRALTASYSLMPAR